MCALRLASVALVAQYRELDLHTDGPLLIEAFDRLGIAVTIVGWGERRDWSVFDAVLVRTTYDYIDRPDEFFAWARSVEAVTRLANPAALLAWNGDKRYLRDLAAAGVPTVPTTWIEPGESGAAALETNPHDEFVVKPATSAGSRLSARYTSSERDRALAHLERLASLGLVSMLQPYLARVDTEGELGTFVFANEVSHAIKKSAALVPGVHAAEDFSIGYSQVVVGQPMTEELESFARFVLDRVPGSFPPSLYARVDALRDANGELVLIELELIEPFLFLDTSAGSADRFAAATAAWLTVAGRSADARPPNPRFPS